MFQQESTRGSGPLGVACPGGIARQFRVQVRESQASGKWRMVASCRESAAAYELSRQMIGQGEEARVVECRSLPTAA